MHVWMDPKEFEVVYCMNASSQPTGNLMVTVVLTFVDDRATPPGFLPVLASQKLILWLDQLPPIGNRPAGRSLRELHPFAIEGSEGFELGGVRILSWTLWDTRGRVWRRQVDEQKLALMSDNSSDS